jgi:hypothetical protein
MDRGCGNSACSVSRRGNDGAEGVGEGTAVPPLGRSSRKCWVGGAPTPSSEIRKSFWKSKKAPHGVRMPGNSGEPLGQRDIKSRCVQGEVAIKEAQNSPGLRFRWTYVLVSELQLSNFIGRVFV